VGKVLRKHCNRVALERRQAFFPLRPAVFPFASSGPGCQTPLCYTSEQRQQQQQQELTWASSSLPKPGHLSIHLAAGTMVLLKFTSLLENDPETMTNTR